MRALSRAVLLVAGIHVVALTAPSVAMAQGPQPVPYGTPPPPVPYGQPGPTPSPSPAPAHVATGGSDIIYLKNGGILRGTIIDAIPNAQARIQLATGEIATVPWPEINKIEHGSETPKAGATPAPVAAPPKGPAPTVWVHIDGPDDVHLQQDTTGDDDWATVCTAPCDKPMPTTYWYRITGNGIKTSKEFALNAQPGQHETVTVNGASKAWFVIGVVAMPVGALVGYIGLLVGLVGSIGSTASSATGSAQGKQISDSTAATGWTMLGIGAVAMVGGLILTLSNWRTGVSQDIGTQTALLQSDAWKRVPSPQWKDASPEQKAMPQAVGIPLLGGSF